MMLNMNLWRLNKRQVELEINECKLGMGKRVRLVLVIPKSPAILTAHLTQNKGVIVVVRASRLQLCFQSMQTMQAGTPALQFSLLSNGRMDGRTKLS